MRGDEAGHAAGVECGTQFQRAAIDHKNLPSVEEPHDHVPVVAAQRQTQGRGAEFDGRAALAGREVHDIQPPCLVGGIQALSVGSHGDFLDHAAEIEGSQQPQRWDFNLRDNAAAPSRRVDTAPRRVPAQLRAAVGDRDLRDDALPRQRQGDEPIAIGRHVQRLAVIRQRRSQRVPADVDHGDQLPPVDVEDVDRFGELTGHVGPVAPRARHDSRGHGPDGNRPRDTRAVERQHIHRRRVTTRDECYVE